jgi:hypothetical protein
MPLQLCLGPFTERLGDLVLALVTAMQVDKCSADGRVAHAIHQLSQRGYGARRQLVAGMT